MAAYKGNADYENLGFLGKGAYGRVFKVKRKSDGEIIAMKQVNMKKLSETEKTAVENEFNLHCSLRHPNIVKVFSFEYDDPIQKNYMFIYMEVCEGGDLHALIDKRVTNKDYLPEVKIWVIIAQLVSALHYMHNLLASDQDSFNILHRDVKPENIFLTATGEVRLGDLGLAARIAQNGSVTGSCGTPVYMAPEVLRKRNYDQAADCWSLGSTLLELISFDYLIDGGSRQNTQYILSQIDGGLDTSIPDHYSPELADFVDRLLSTEPSQRPTTAAMINEPCVQWGQTQIKLDESRRCQQATLKQLEKNKKAAEAREHEKNARIQALEAELLALQSATEEVTFALELHEKEMAAREAQVDKQERRQAQIAKRLEEKESKLLQDRAAFDQLCSSPVDLITRAPIELSSRSRYNSASSSVSKVSQNLTGDVKSSSTSVVGASCAPLRVAPAPESQTVELPSNKNIVRRRADTGNLHKRYAPVERSHPSRIPLPVEAFTEHKLPSEGDLHEALKVSKRSNIPISTRVLRSKAHMPTISAKPDDVIPTKNTNVQKQRKGAENNSPVIQQVVPLVAPHRYHTRGAARNANKALTLRQL